MILLWLDDMRDPTIPIHKVPDGYSEVVWVTTYNEFCEWITEHGLPTGISFDHDLGDFFDGVERTGKDCANWLVNYCLDTNQKLPTYFCHSGNSVGKRNILSILNQFSEQ